MNQDIYTLFVVTVIMTQLKKLRKAEKQKILYDNRGMLARIASDLECDASLVSRVFWGKTTSRKVREAIESRLSTIEVAA